NAVLGFTPRHLIGGELVDGPSSFPVINPATGESFASCPDSTKAMLDEAVAKALAAQRDWAGVDVAQRRDYVARFAQRLVDHKDAIARLITLEQGKPLAASLGEVQRAADSMLEICTIPIDAELLREDARGRVELHYKPLGVIAAITPWNVPIALGAPKIASALYTGNTVILKPSRNTPFSSLLMAKVTQDVLPAGVFSVLTGGGSLGQAMCEHPNIAKINFTGSVPTGKHVMQSAAPTLKRLTLELGGNDAAIVLDDVDIAEIAPRLFFGAFGLAGQVCMAIKRLYVQEALYEPLVERMSRLAEQAKLGDGFEEGVEIGPLQNKGQFEEVLEIIEETRQVPGARITAGGYALNRPGYFIAPTVVADIHEGTRLVDEEPFGPILPILSFKTVDEAVARANASRFGLGGSVWTRDVKRGAEIAARLEAGFTWVNHHVGTTRDLPFGGMKESGIGRNGGAIGVKSDMEAQVVFAPPA
ncbi:MAG: aldehyde dehydrogenase family protein, partial [Amphiplicatus sp.]